MRAADIRLDKQYFTSVRIDMKGEFNLGQLPEPIAGDILAGLNVVSNVACAAEPVDDPHQYAITLDVTIDESEENAKFPYLVHVQTLAFFSVREGGHPDRSERLNYALTHAVPRLYSSICELVSNLTARSWHGTADLPVMEFATQYGFKDGEDSNEE